MKDTEDFMSELRNKLISDKIKEHFDESLIGLTIYNLLKEKEDLQQRITKALDKIKELYDFGNEWHWDNGAIEYEIKELEEILRGEK